MREESMIAMLATKRADNEILIDVADRVSERVTVNIDFRELNELEKLLGDMIGEEAEEKKIVCLNQASAWNAKISRQGIGGPTNIFFFK